jgi:predicted glycosyltransferase
MPFLDVIITPTSFLDDLGPKQIRINSYKELAYLHPDYYKPSEEIFDLLKLSYNESYAVVRFNSFDATHDFGVKGFQLKDKIDLINMLNKHTKVFLSFEGVAPKSIARYKLRVPKTRIHDVLYYANLLVCDTQTMATEAAILGTPVIRSNSFVGPKDMGNFIELEKKYGLIFNIRDPKVAIRKAEELIKDSHLKREWREKRQRLLEDKCDITKFMIWFIEKYPQSFKDIKENLGIYGNALNHKVVGPHETHGGFLHCQQTP